MLAVWVGLGDAYDAAEIATVNTRTQSNSLPNKSDYTVFKNCLRNIKDLVAVPSITSHLQVKVRPHLLPQLLWKYTGRCEVLVVPNHNMRRPVLYGLRSI